jgi:MFS family permease
MVQTSQANQNKQRHHKNTYAMHAVDRASAQFSARLVTVSSFFSDLTFILPIWLLYSLHVLHIKPTLAIGIFMSIWIVSALLEIPTGALADRLGRRKLFIVGQFLFSLYPLAYALKFPLALLFAVCLLSAAGSSMRSGALLPIVHAAYKQAGLPDKDYDTFLSNNQMATFIARILAGVSGAWLYTRNPTWPFYAMFGATMFNCVLGLFVTDTVVPKKKVSNLAHIKRTLALIQGNGILIAILAAFVALNLGAETIWTGYQVLFQTDGRSAVVIGILFSMIAACSTIGAYLVRHAMNRLHPYQLMQFFGFSVLGTAVLLAQPNHTLRLAAIIPMGFGSGTTLVVINSVMQKQIENRYQATALSITNFLQYGVYAIGSLAFGILLQTLGATHTRLALLGTSLVAAAGVLIYGLLHRTQLQAAIVASPAAYATAIEPAALE